MKVIYCTCFFSECGSSTSTRARSHGHKEMETSLHTKFCIVNPHKCESEILSKSGSTPVGGPVKSGRRWTKVKGRGLDKRLVRPELVTAWIQ